MIATADPKNVKQVVHLMARADRFNRLAKRCPRHCRPDFYRLKDRALVKALTLGAGQFVVDSIIEGWSLTLGLTHITGRRVHVTPYKMPGRIQVLLHQLAAENSVTYPLFRMDQGGWLQKHNPAILNPGKPHENTTQKQ